MVVAGESSEMARQEGADRARRIPGALRVGVALLLPVVCACASVSRVIPAPSTQDRASAAGKPGGYERWWASVTAVVEAELGLAAVDAMLVLCPHQRAFENALVEDGMPVELAHQVARTLDAVGRPGKVLIKESSLGTLRWPRRILVLAHELVHTVQYTLAGGRRSTSEQWLREGLAEWVSWRVIEHLRMGSLAAHRRHAEQRLAAARRTHALPALSALRTGPELLAELARDRTVPVYDQAFLAVDMLIAEHGVQAVVEYFRRFATSDDREASFLDSFGESHAAFEERFVAR